MSSYWWNEGLIRIFIFGGFSWVRWARGFSTAALNCDFCCFSNFCLWWLDWPTALSYLYTWNKRSKYNFSRKFGKIESISWLELSLSRKFFLKITTLDIAIESLNLRHIEENMPEYRNRPRISTFLRLNVQFWLAYYLCNNNISTFWTINTEKNVFHFYFSSNSYLIRRSVRLVWKILRFSGW